MPMWDTAPLPVGWTPKKKGPKLIAGWEPPGLDTRRVGIGDDYPDESSLAPYQVAPPQLNPFQQFGNMLGRLPQAIPAGFQESVNRVEANRDLATGAPQMGDVMDLPGNIITNIASRARGYTGSPSLPPNTIAPGQQQTAYETDPISQIPVVGGLIPQAVNPLSYVGIPGVEEARLGRAGIEAAQTSRALRGIPEIAGAAAEKGKPKINPEDIPETWKAAAPKEAPKQPFVKPKVERTPEEQNYAARIHELNKQQMSETGPLAKQINDLIKQAPEVIQDAWRDRLENHRNAAAGDMRRNIGRISNGEATEFRDRLAAAINKPVNQAAAAAAKGDSNGAADALKGVASNGRAATSTPKVGMSQSARRVVRVLPSLSPDMQKSAANAVLLQMSKPNMAAQGIGAVVGGVTGYEASGQYTDDMRLRLLVAALGAGEGLKLGHVLTGGTAAGIGNRAVEWWRRSLFGPRLAFGVKAGTDVTQIPLSSFARVLDSSWRGLHGNANVWKEILGKPSPDGAGGLMWGYAMSVPTAAKRYIEAMDPRLSGGQKLAENVNQLEQRDPGQYVTSLWGRQIEGISNFFEELHIGGETAANAQAMAHYESKVAPTLKQKDADEWLSSRISEALSAKGMDAEEVAGLSSEDKALHDYSIQFYDKLKANFPDAAPHIELGHLDAPEVQSAAMELFKADKVNSWASRNLRNPVALAQEALLLSPLERRGTLGRAQHTLEELGRTRNPKISEALTKQVSAMRGQEPVFAGITGRIHYFLGNLQRLPALGKILVPFRVVPANAIDRVVDHIPGIGILNHLDTILPRKIQPGWVEKGRFKTPTNRLVTSQIVGTAMATAAVLTIKAHASNFNGDGPPDPKQRQNWIEKGFRPWSFQMADGNWHPMSEMPPPIEAGLRFMGAAADELNYGAPMKDEFFREFGSALADHNFLPNFYSVFTAGLSRNTTQQQAQQGPGAAFQQELKYQGASAVRALAGPTARDASDALRQFQPDLYSKNVSLPQTLQRQAETLMPGNQTVPPRLDVGKMPEPNPRQGPEALLETFAGTRPYTDQATSNLAVGEQYRETMPDWFKGSPLGAQLQHQVDVKIGDKLDQTLTGLKKDPRYDVVPSNFDSKDAYHTALRNHAFLDAEKKAIQDVVKEQGEDTVRKQLDAADPTGGMKSSFNNWIIQQKVDAVPRYANKDGSPYKPDQWGKMDAAIAKAANNKALSQTVTPDKKAEEQARYLKAQAIVNSPNYADYERQHMHFNVPGGTAVKGDPAWQLFMTGKVQLFGKPGQYSPQQQLDMAKAVRLYNGLPAGSPAKEAKKVQYQHLRSLANVARSGWLEEVEGTAAPPAEAEPTPEPEAPAL